MFEISRWWVICSVGSIVQLSTSWVGAQSVPVPTSVEQQQLPQQNTISPTTAETGETKPEPQQDKEVRPDIREADANADRVILLPTAETHPKGRAYFSAHELIFWQLGYAFTDRIQATITTWPVIVENQPFFIDASFKANIFRSDVARLALAGGVTYVASTVDSINDTASVGRLAAIGQFCLTSGCWTSLVGGISGWVPLSEGKGTLFAGGVGLTTKLSKHVGLIFEFDSGGIYDNKFEMAEGGLINYGVRFSGSNIGVDLAMMKPTFDDGDLVMGLPWISFTYRSDPISF